MVVLERPCAVDRLGPSDQVGPDAVVDGLLAGLRTPVGHTLHTDQPEVGERVEVVQRLLDGAPEQLGALLVLPWREHGPARGPARGRGLVLAEEIEELLVREGRPARRAAPEPGADRRDRRAHPVLAELLLKEEGVKGPEGRPGVLPVEPEDAVGQRRPGPDARGPAGDSRLRPPGPRCRGSRCRSCTPRRQSLPGTSRSPRRGRPAPGAAGTTARATRRAAFSGGTPRPADTGTGSRWARRAPEPAARCPST